MGSPVTFAVPPYVDDIGLHHSQHAHGYSDFCPLQKGCGDGGYQAQDEQYDAGL